MIASWSYTILWMADLSTICLSCYLSIRCSRDVKVAMREFLLVFNTQEQAEQAIDYLAQEIRALKH